MEGAVSLNRFAPKRDGNEGIIRKRFAHHGWHTEQLSGKGMPDLLCFPMKQARDLLSDMGLPGGHLRLCALVDVKELTGKPTPSQAVKWKALSAKGIPVYVARTAGDVDAIVAGSAEPWGVMEARPKRGKGQKRAPRIPRRVAFNDVMDELVPERKRHRCQKNGCQKYLPCADHDRAMKRAPRPAYEAPVPRASATNSMATKAVVPSNAAEHRALLAAQEAEETFAVAPERDCEREECGGCEECT